MVNKINVGDHYPGYNHKTRSHFEHPVSRGISTNPARVQLVENFNRLPFANGDIAVASNLHFEVLGTNSGASDITFATTVGGIKLETDGAGNDQVIIVPHLTSGTSAWTGTKWGTENQVIWECVLRTGSSVADLVIWAGLKKTNTSVVATDTDQAFFRFDGVTVANWEATYSISGTDTETDTGVAVAADTNYYLRIEFDSDRRAHFFINDTEVAASSALTNDVDLIPYIGIEDTSAAAVHMYVVKEKISRIVFE